MPPLLIGRACLGCPAYAKCTNISSSICEQAREKIIVRPGCINSISDERARLMAIERHILSLQMDVLNRTIGIQVLAAETDAIRSKQVNNS